MNFVDLGGRSNTPQEIGYWTAQNASQDRPGLNHTNPRGYSYPSNASYTRLKDVTLNYTFPATLTDKLHLGSLSVYLSGRNLYTWTPWKGWDPEQNYTLGNGTGNIDNPASSNAISVNPVNSGTNTAYANYPNVRTVVLGLNVSLR